MAPMQVNSHDSVPGHEGFNLEILLRTSRIAYPIEYTTHGVPDLNISYMSAILEM